MDPERSQKERSGSRASIFLQKSRKPIENEKARNQSEKSTFTKKSKMKMPHESFASSGAQPHNMKLTQFSNGMIQVQATLDCQYKDKYHRYHDYREYDGATLSEGDRFRVIFSALQNAYVYVFLTNDHGDKTMLFPDRGVDNYVKAKSEYVIPGNDWYELDDA
jgi:hypothetical protein